MTSTCSRRASTGSPGSAFVAALATVADIPPDYAEAIARLVDRADRGEPLPVIIDELVVSFGEVTLDLGAVIADGRASQRRPARGRRRQ